MVKHAITFLLKMIEGARYANSENNMRNKATRSFCP